MSQRELLTAALHFLNSRHIAYMLTGSVVSSIQGEPRLTHDIDLVVECSAAIGPQLQEVFPPPRYYVDIDAIKDAIGSEGMFNLIDTDEGDKIDFWILTGSAFDENRFARRQQTAIWGEVAWVSSPEDTILAKLRWAKLSGGSQKQIHDAAKVCAVNHDQLDMRYLQHWILQLGLRVQREAMDLLLR